MPTTYKNRLRCAVSAVASSGLGAWTVSTAASGAVTFAAGDDGKTFTVLGVEGTAWEVRTGCVYTHSGTSLSRGTLESSSTGSAITFTTACVLDATFSADAVRRWDAAALDHVAGTDANTTMEVNTLYVVDMSAWATADRTYTLPATAAVGDRVGIMVSAGDASHELLITAASGDTLNAVAGGTEWSRLFITGEVVIMRCVAADATWVVEYDGRIAQQGLMRLSTNASGETANTFVQPTNFSGAWTADTDVGNVCTTASGRITTRRAGKFSFGAFGFSTGVPAAGKFFSVALYKSGTANLLVASTFQIPALATVGQQAGAHVEGVIFAAGDYVVYQYRSEEGSKGLTSSTSPRVISWFSMVEVF